MRSSNLVGKRFGRLLIIRHEGYNKEGRSLWLCQCDCGNKKIIRGNSLKRGLTRSCGCLRIEKAKLCHSKHKYSRTPTYIVWSNMKNRCYNKKHRQYKNYGGRGIRVCKRWLNKKNGFNNFLIDMGEKPKDKFLDRMNNNKLKNGYSPGNCNWSTKKEQNRNTRSNLAETFNGKTQCRSAFAEEYSIDKSTLAYRLDVMGLSIEEALTRPTRKIKENK